MAIARRAVSLLGVALQLRPCVPLLLAVAGLGVGLLPGLGVSLPGQGITLRPRMTVTRLRRCGLRVVSLWHPGGLLPLVLVPVAMSGLTLLSRPPVSRLSQRLL